MPHEVSNKKFSVDLSGQVALVTGASRGIGKAIALALGRCGAKVACVARDTAKLAETVSAIQSAGGQAEAFHCDVTKCEAVATLVESIAEKWGRLDILVNNAGITPRYADATHERRGGRRAGDRGDHRRWC